MSLEFQCPHCNGVFQVAQPPAGRQVPCPHCQHTLAIPAGARSETTADEPWAADTAEQPPADAPGDAVFSELIAGADEGKRASASRRRSAAKEPLPAPRRLTQGERERRRQRRSLVLMVGGLIILALTAFLLSRLSE